MTEKVERRHSEEGLGKFNLHPKVAMPLVAGAMVEVIIGVLKSTGVIDLSAFQVQLTIVVMGAVGWYVPST